MTFGIKNHRNSRFLPPLPPAHPQPNRLPPRPLRPARHLHCPHLPRSHPHDLDGRQNLVAKTKPPHPHQRPRRGRVDVKQAIPPSLPPSLPPPLPPFLEGRET